MSEVPNDPGIYAVKLGKFIPELKVRVFKIGLLDSSMLVKVGPIILSESQLPSTAIWKSVQNIK